MFIKSSSCVFSTFLLVPCFFVVPDVIFPRELFPSSVSLFEVLCLELAPSLCVISHSVLSHICLFQEVVGLPA